MTLTDRIAECTAHDLSRFLPFEVDGQRAGWVRRDLLPALAEHAGGDGAALDVADRRVALGRHLDGFEARTAAMSSVVRSLEASGHVPALTPELYDVGPAFGAAPWFALERAAMPTFGARAHGVHLHGYVRDAGGGLRMWIARRARDRTTFPGMLDNLVAGGLPRGLTPRENLVKECAEEADIPRELAERAVPVGAVTYRNEIPRGLRNDVLFLYDLELPPDFVPRNTDGEVESFELWPVERVMARVAETRDFKFNCNLTLIDFFIRHGLVGPEHPEYLDLVEGLRVAAPAGDPSPNGR